MGFRYIICDDAPFIRELLKDQLFKLNGLCLAESDHVTETVMLCEQLRPDYLILDLVLPNKSGVELFHLLANDVLKISIVICTSLDRDVVLNKYPFLSKYPYIQKPFNFHQLSQMFQINNKSEVINE